MIQPTNFEIAVEFTINREGREFVFNPLDKGGPTKFGITQSTLAAFRNAVVSDDDVKNLCEEEAIRIYASKYWNVARLERIKDVGLATILFDFAVNAGPQTSIKLLQRVLNEEFQESLDEDGQFGNTTYAAIPTTANGEERLCRKLLQHIQTYYARICGVNPKQLVFLEGWLNRSFALWDFVS